MATIVTRAGKGSALTHGEMDSNFTNLNTDKIELSDLSITSNSAADTSVLSYASGTGVFTFTPADASGKAVLTGSTNNTITTVTGANAIQGEANFTFDGSNAVLSGSAGGLTSPVLELETDNSGWNRPALMFKDSNNDVVSIVGQNYPAAGFYQLNYTLDPNNDNGRQAVEDAGSFVTDTEYTIYFAGDTDFTAIGAANNDVDTVFTATGPGSGTGTATYDGITTWAGDYYIDFKKDYSDQAETKMLMNVYGAHNGFNISAFDDFNDGGGGRYNAKPIRLQGSQIELYADDTGTPFGDFTQIVTVDSDSVDITQDVVITDTKQLKFGSTTTIDKDEISTTGGFTINVDSDTSSNESFIIQSAGADAFKFNRGPGGDAELQVLGDGFFIKDENDDTIFSMDMSSASNTGLNIFRRDENKSLSFTLKTDDDDDTGTFDGAWTWKSNADERSLMFEYDSTQIYEIRDSADVATAAPTDIFEFKIPVVLPSFVVASLPTTVVTGAQAYCTNETGGAVPVFFDGSNWRRCTDRAIAS